MTLTLKFRTGVVLSFGHVQGRPKSLARKRLARFKEVRRAWISLWILMVLYLVSLGSELICNGTPLYVHFKGKSYFPFLFFYPEDAFVGGGRKTRPDYKAFGDLAPFKDDASAVMIFAPIPYGPFESIDPASIPVSDDVTALLTPMPAVGSVNVGRDFSILRSQTFSAFAEKGEEDLTGKDLRKLYPLSPQILEGIARRFANLAAPMLTEAIEGPGGRKAQVFLSTYAPREGQPESVRLLFREAASAGPPEKIRILFKRENDGVAADARSFSVMASLSPEDRNRLSDQARRRFLGPVEPHELTLEGRRFRVDFSREEVRFPYPPVQGHWMGIDAAGRDVLARILYGLRTSLTFGLLLVAGSMALGIFAGAVQGYYGGILDITAQRLIEIWSALPFLYIMILMGSIYGRSFLLLLLCYGLFNWIGISYYIRAEFLRLQAVGLRGGGAVHGHPHAQDHVQAHPAQRPDARHHLFPLFPGGRHRCSGRPGLSGLRPAASHAQLGGTPVSGPAIPVGLVADPVSVPGPFHGHAAGRVRGGRGPKRLRSEALCEAGVIMNPLLEVKGLTVSFSIDEGTFRAVDRVSFQVSPGEIVGLVGESGCGKSVTALSILRLVPSPPGRIDSGRILFKGKDLLDAGPARMQEIRGNEISMIFQEPMSALSPLHRIGHQLVEAVLLHRDVSKKEAWSLAES